LPACHAQAALLLEEPYGFFGAINPTGHVAIYFENICAETPVSLRRCEPGEFGAVVARYEGMSGHDWVAVPLIPYLYSVENITHVPDRADRKTVTNLRDQYHEAHLLPTLGSRLRAGSIVQGGWSQLVGVAYDRRIYAFRFATTPREDDALIARLNSSPNQSHFDLLFNNCADFARGVLNSYFPKTFHRNVFPDAGMTTPRQIAYRLVRYARKHPEAQLTVFDIAQVPGNRRLSHSNKSVAQSLSTTAYAIPIVLMNPYLAGGLFVDFLLNGRHDPVPRGVKTLDAENLFALTSPHPTAQNHPSASSQATGIATFSSTERQGQGSAY
jgi:hypothetical protein